ncbi:MAG: PEP-CTERM sorting domain-containing protein, partial [Mesorhizobium sp.]|nr:PEP-CTERM sorting domain-containing protein [Mesorhizobium sp.]
ISYSSFLSQYGGTGLAYVTLDVDAGYSSPQQLTVSNFSLNGTNFGAPVPEPATWAMMIIGFGGIGFAMRRQRKAPQLPQAA